MIIGNENLKELFPEFEDCIKENGIDLKIGSVEHTTNRNNKLIGCIDGEKHLPVTYEVKRLLQVMVSINSIHIIITLS